MRPEYLSHFFLYVYWQVFFRSKLKMQTGFNKLEECCWVSVLWASQQDTAFVPPWHQE